MRPSLFTYVPRGTRHRTGGEISVQHGVLVLSVGIRDRKAVCLVIPLETRRGYERRQLRQHRALVARVLPR